MRVQKTRKRQRQREHVKQNLREHKQRNMEFYNGVEQINYVDEDDKPRHVVDSHLERRQTEEVRKPRHVVESSHEDMLIFGSKKVAATNPVVKKTTISNKNKSAELDILNDPKKLDEFKKFQEYLKMKEQTAKEEEIKVREVKIKEVIKEEEKEEENNYEFEYEDDTN